jgi:hypothetical protein
MVGKKGHFIIRTGDLFHHRNRSGADAIKNFRSRKNVLLVYHIGQVKPAKDRGLRLEI